MSTPKSETPRSETPKSETPKSETPKSETPKSVTPKSETPLVETPRGEALRKLIKPVAQERALVKAEKAKAIQERVMAGCPTKKTVCLCPHPQSSGRYIYSVFHSIMSIIAIYLAFRCNKGFSIGPFMLALCCPYIYIIYVLATQGTCGIIQNEPSFKAF